VKGRAEVPDLPEITNLATNPQKLNVNPPRNAPLEIQRRRSRGFFSRLLRRWKERRRQVKLYAAQALIFLVLMMLFLALFWVILNREPQPEPDGRLKRTGPEISAQISRWQWQRRQAIGHIRRSPSTGWSCASGRAKTPDPDFRPSRNDRRPADVMSHRVRETLLNVNQTSIS